LKYDDDEITSTVKALTEFVKEEGKKLTAESLFTEVKVHQATKDFDNQVRMFIVVSALFPNGSLNDKGVVARKKFIKAFIDNGKLSFATWIFGFQAYLATYPSASKTFPMTLKALYDEDLAEEESILEYYNKSQSSPDFENTRKVVQPFLKWLETANDSDDDSEDEDEDDSD